MASILEFLDRLLGFLDRGGNAMPFILLLSLCMWVLILERYWFLRFTFPQELARAQATWDSRRERRSRTARYVRMHLAASLGASARRTLPIIRTLVQVLPLLGLLGTVTGMIETFEVIAVYGGSNRRGIAGGISEALLCTLAGLVTALSGLYFAINLDQNARRAEEQTACALSYE
ncbi:MAG: MotA/TolQ/ExbB proton channel family protein [Gammaproteobacteria bacterium]